MRVQKASLNVIINILTFIFGLFPSFIVTKAFLDSLGNELFGLSALYTNIIGILSIVELGIGNAIIYSLYKPFARDDKEKIKGYLNFYRRFYLIVGFIILLSGLVLIPFIPMFVNSSLSMFDAKLYFFLFVINTFISYLFSSRLCIFNVAQEGYKISIATTCTKLIISFLQFCILNLFPNFYLFICIQIIINLAYYLFMNIYINKCFPWINTTLGRLNIEEKKSLTKNVKAIFLHQIGGMVVFGVDNIVISSFLSITLVGIFNSYNMVLGAAQGLLSSALSGVTASIGNLLTEENTQNAYQVHKRLFFLSFWLVSFVTISLFNTLKQFVILWLGEKQILDQLTICVVLINFYFFLMRGSVERFNEGGGIYYQDRYAPLIEALINLIASIILVKIMGLAGVFLGTLISNISVVFWVKPKLAYKYVFKKKLSEYFKMYFKFFLIALIPLIITYIATIHLKKLNSFMAFSENCLINIIVINIFYFIVFMKNDEYLYFKKLILSYMNKSLKRSLSI